MAYIGLQPQQKTLGTSTQKLSGNGIDFEFMLNRGVSKAADLRVFIGDTEQVPEVDYTATGTLLLFTNPPTSGTNNIVINYIAGALTTLNINANSYPVGTTTNPSIRSADAQSTGIYFPTTTSLGITVSGNTRLAVTDSPTAVSTSTGAVRVAGGLGMTGSLYTGGIVRIQDTTQAVSSASGALIVDGGMGIAKEVFIGGGLQVAGDFTVAGQFTTTGSDSLILNDPFIFLANANPGDNLDTGFVSSYFDGFNTRYTGFFRDITDGEYKLFNNLIVAPTTVVDTGNISFRYANIRVGNITADNVYGTIAGSTSISEVGNLTQLKVQSTIESWGINYVYSTQASTSTTTGALQVSGGVGVAGNVAASGGIFNSITVSGTATATTFSGSGASLTSIPAGQLSGTTLAAGVTASSLTSVGTLSTLIVGNSSGIRLRSVESGGAIYIQAGNGTGGSANTITFAPWTSTTSTMSIDIANRRVGIRKAAPTVELDVDGSAALTGSISVNSGNGVTAIVNGGTGGVGNIGASGQGFNTVFARATSAQYADVAERYLADADYEPGTVLHFDGDYEVSQCNADACTRVAGVVSTNPAYIMNDSLVGEHVVEVALLGRVPCKVEGTVQRGDMMVSAGNGRARAEANPKLGSVIGKALENFNGEVGVIEVVVGRN
jgi:hypothetical protein